MQQRKLNMLVYYTVIIVVIECFMLKTEKLINEIVLLRENVNLLQGQLSEANKRIAELIKERDDLIKYWQDAS